jgi:hypothetical protein
VEVQKINSNKRKDNSTGLRLAHNVWMGLYTMKVGMIQIPCGETRNKPPDLSSTLEWFWCIVLTLYIHSFEYSCEIQNPRCCG